MKIVLGQLVVLGAHFAVWGHYETVWTWINWSQSHILFCKYLGPLISHRNGFVLKICIYILVFRRQKWFENPILGSGDIKQKPSLFFLWHPVQHSGSANVYHNGLGRHTMFDLVVSILLLVVVQMRVWATNLKTKWGSYLFLYFKLNCYRLIS